MHELNHVYLHWSSPFRVVRRVKSSRTRNLEWTNLRLLFSTLVSWWLSLLDWMDEWMANEWCDESSIEEGDGWNVILFILNLIELFHTPHFCVPLSFVTLQIRRRRLWGIFIWIRAGIHYQLLLRTVFECVGKFCTFLRAHPSCASLSHIFQDVSQNPRVSWTLPFELTLTRPYSTCRYLCRW